MVVARYAAGLLLVVGLGNVWAQDGAVPLLTGVRQLTRAGARAGEGYFSADGTYMIFQSERHPGNPFYQMYLMDLESSHVRRLSPGVGRTTCGWLHPRGQKALFSSSHLNPRALEEQEQEWQRRRDGAQGKYAWEFDPYFDLFESDWHGGNLRRLTEAVGYDAEASYSPDGEWIAFASNRKAYEGGLSDEDKKILERDPSYFMDLYLMRQDGTEVRQLTTDVGYDGGPFFSPDGRSLIYRHFSPDGKVAEVFTLDLATGATRQLTQLGAVSWAPYYHPSGDYFVFATSVHGHRNFELYLGDVSGKHPPVRVTESEGFDGLPVFSPDAEGKRIAWTSNRHNPNGGAQIYIANWDDAEARNRLKLGPRRGRLDALDPDIRESDIQRHLSALTSWSMAGRGTGAEGERNATEYVAQVFEKLGLEPVVVGEKDRQNNQPASYFQEFRFTKGVRLGPKCGLVQGRDGDRRSWTSDRDWRPLAQSRRGRSDGQGGEALVFAGYGIRAPAGTLGPYDAYEGRDPRGKWVMLLRYLPEAASMERKAQLLPHSGLRDKVALARDLGARGVLVVTGPNASGATELVPLEKDPMLTELSIPMLTITNELAESMLGGDGGRLRGLQDLWDKGDVPTQEQQGTVTFAKEWSVEVDLEQEYAVGRNVLGRVRFGDGNNPVIVVGAHVDHLGHHETAGGSDEVFHGADDNASGVSAMLEIAHLAADAARRGRPGNFDVIFAAWSGEELGLLGSKHFVANFPRPQGAGIYPNIAAALNMDMVGRVRDKIFLQGVDSSPVWLPLIETMDRAGGTEWAPIVTQGDPYLPTDVMSFYLAGVPVLNAFSGSHPEYHTPQDTREKINIRGIHDVAWLMTLVLDSMQRMDAAPPYVQVPARSGGGGGFRVYLGTIPDYEGGGIRGVRLTGVAPHSPAAQAGLVAGDVIVRLAQMPVEDIYDYSRILGLIRVGEKYDIEVRRGGVEGEVLRFEVVPEARP